MVLNNSKGSSRNVVWIGTSRKVRGSGRVDVWEERGVNRHQGILLLLFSCFDGIMLENRLQLRNSVKHLRLPSCGLTGLDPSDNV